MLDDKELIKRITSGDQIALRELMGIHKGQLYNFIKKYIRDEEESLDILQETFCKVYFKASSYKPEYSLKAGYFR